VTHSLQRLYAAYTEARRGETLVAAQMADRDDGSRFEANPIERVRELIEANRNYFPELEAAAENLRDELNVPSEGLFAALSTRLREKHSIVTRIMPVDVMRETLRRFDRHRRQLLISELVDGPGRAFQIAFQLGLAECSASFETIVNRAGPLDDTPRRLYRITLANYFAAAAMMPYQAFHNAAESLSYDVHVLAQRFNAGFEQVCHRLTTLQRPNARGVPFFMLRVDNAGNVSKRFSSGTRTSTSTSSSIGRSSSANTYRSSFVRNAAASSSAALSSSASTSTSSISSIASSSTGSLYAAGSEIWVYSRGESVPNRVRCCD